MQTLPDSYVLFVVTSILGIIGWAIRTHFKLQSAETNISSQDARIVETNARVGHMDGSMNSIFVELAKIGARLDNMIAQNREK